MSGSEIIETAISEGHTDFVVLEPRSVFDDGVIGFDRETNKLIYGLGELVQALIRNGFSKHSEDAMEWIDYNTLGTCVGLSNSPLIVVKDWEGVWTDVVRNEPVAVEIEGG